MPKHGTMMLAVSKINKWSGTRYYNDKIILCLVLQDWKVVEVTPYEIYLLLPTLLIM